MEGKEKSLGAIWLNIAKNGKKYLIVKVNNETLIGFKNDHRKEEKDPYYFLYEKKHR